MIIKNNTLNEHAKGWAIFLVTYGIIYAITLFMARFVDASWDMQTLLFLNPDAYIPVLDEMVILQTDFATYFFALLLISWQIGYYCIRNRKPEAALRTRNVFYVLAAVFGVWHALGLFIQDKNIFWWGEYEYPIVFLPLGIAFAGGFVVAGNLYIYLRPADQRKLAHAFWLTLLAVFFVNVLGEDIVKETIQRHRPLHETYDAWNGQVRQLQDEVVRGSYSYISGHTSSFWALTMIYFWLFKSWKVRIGLVVWAAFHGFTRIYTAAHFPYCVIMATFFAVPVTSMIYYCLWNHRHIPLVSTLALSGGLFMLAKSPAIPSVILAIVLVWFALYRFRSSYVPLEPMPDAHITFSQ